jgi:protoporphyrinogen IX oxidase
VSVSVLAQAYPWVKTLHVVSMVAWMAGMFYLPRLFVYHCAMTPGSVESERFKVMERRLLKQITTPAMLATVLFGALLALTPGIVDWASGWWYVKLAGVLALGAFHGKLSRWRRDFLEDRNTHSHRYFRYANEVPTVLLLVIVAMVIARPF